MEYEFKIVGKDEEGNPLYRRVLKQSAEFLDPNSNKLEDQSSDFVPPLASPMEQMMPPKSINNQPIKTISQKSPTQPSVNTVKNMPNDFLYGNMDDRLVEFKHQASVKKYPSISFRDKEFVIKIINRHPLGMVAIWAVAAFINLLMILVWSIIFFAPNSAIRSTISTTANITFFGFIIFVSLILMSIIFAYVISSIYSANKMIITSERVVQYLSNGLFDHKKQTIDLGWIEDVSYHKTGIVASIFNFGSIRLSTIGDESTYYMKWVRSPETIASQLNELVLAVKNEDPMPNIYD